MFFAADVYYPRNLLWVWVGDVQIPGHGYWDVQVVAHPKGVFPPLFPMNPSKCLENIVYHNFRQLWLLLGVKLMEINTNLFSRWSKKAGIEFTEVFKLWSFLPHPKTYCWWGLNPAPPGMYETLSINYQPQGGFLAGFLNHQQVRANQKNEKT